MSQATNTRAHCTKEDHNKLRTDEEWIKLRKRPDWVIDETETLEQRDCPRCRSTLARVKKEGTDGVEKR